MNPKHKLYFAAATLIAVLIIGNSIRSYFHITRLERAVERTKHVADEQQHRSDELEKQTYIYKDRCYIRVQKKQAVQLVSHVAKFIHGPLDINIIRKT